MFSHIDKNGHPKMVDILEKTPSQRLAKARVLIEFPKDLLGQIVDERGEIYVKKGPVFQTAIIAGTMAVKKTYELIPFCHTISIEKCKFHMEWVFGKLQIDCEVGTSAKTGVEMEALTGASIAALTVYDMCKSLSHEIVIGPCRLLEKSGGKSDFLHA